MSIQVEVPDQFKGYVWDENAYADWCRAHCIYPWRVTKYTGSTITATFEDQGEASMFLLRWS